MGNFFNKNNNTVLTTDGSVIIFCDSNQIITSCTDEVSELLLYDKNDLIGKNITMIMSDIVASVHIDIFEQLNESNIEQYKYKIRNNMDNLRKYYVYNSKNEPVQVTVDVQLNQDRTSKITLKKDNGILSPQVPKKYLCSVGNKLEFNVDQYSDVICIMMDVANSTEYGKHATPLEIALLYFQINKIAEEYINKYFYPYAYVHETCGDCLFIVVNADFIKKYEKLSSSITLRIATKVQTEIDKFLSTYNQYNLYLRCGITIGDVCAGIIDGKNFRIFGDIVNKSNRLQIVCDKGEITFDSEFNKKIIEEHGVKLKNLIISKETELKSYGQQTIYSINSLDLQKKFGNLHCAYANFN